MVDLLERTITDAAGVGFSPSRGDSFPKAIVSAVIIVTIGVGLGLAYNHYQKQHPKREVQPPRADLPESF